MKILLIDPAYINNGRTSPSNLGDVIISRAVQNIIFELFPSSQLRRISSHEFPRFSDARMIVEANLVFVGGSNLLSFHMLRRRLWRIGLVGTLLYRNLQLCGVGWSSYQYTVDLYGKWISKLILSKNKVHSCRDRYTVERLRELGFINSLYTGCPTTWNIDAGHLGLRRSTKGGIVIMTLTDYNKSYVDDRYLIELITKLYGSNNCFFWPQGLGDAEYVNSLGYKGNLLGRSLASLDQIITTMSFENIDYVGTRLHCGIYCMERHVRSLIISIDNRATEMAKDSMLPVVPRSDLAIRLEHWIETGDSSGVKIDNESIIKWKSSILAGVAQ